MMTRFFELYNAIFDDDGNVKACDHKMRQEIILLSDQIEYNVKHGESDTGLMDVDAIKSLKSNLIQTKLNICKKSKN